MSQIISIDLRGLRCPVSTLRLKKRLKDMRVGDTVRVSSDDFEARNDFPALFKRVGLDYTSLEEEQGYQIFVAFKRL